MSKEKILEGNKLIAEFMMYSKFGDINLSHICTEEKLSFLEDYKYNSDWSCLMPVFDKFTKDFDISWRISSTLVSLYNPQTNIDGRWEINCPENIIVDAWRGVVSAIKDINQNKLNETN